MSRPSSSVPHQREGLGESRRSGRLIWAGSWGASQGAKIAQRTKMITNPTPAAANGLCRATRGRERDTAAIIKKPLTRKQANNSRKRRPACLRTAQCLARGECFSLPNPRIHRRVQQVGEEIHYHVRQTDGQNASLHHEEVSIRDGIDHQPPDSRPRQNSL